MSEQAFKISSAPEAIRTDSPSKFSVYSNATEIGLSPWDIRIKFMENTGTGGPLDLTVHGTIVMSPLHAKAFLTALQHTLSIYEEKAGELDFQKVIASFNPQSPA